nr:hypothetical protein [Novosphingobium sp. MD-1]
MAITLQVACQDTLDAVDQLVWVEWLSHEATDALRDRLLLHLRARKRRDQYQRHGLFTEYLRQLQTACPRHLYIADNEIEPPISVSKKDIRRAEGHGVDAHALDETSERRRNVLVIIDDRYQPRRPIGR